VIVDRATAALLLALCRAELPETERARIAGLLDQPVDWSQLANLAGLHGVVALVRHNLLVLHAHERVPFDPWEHIQQAAAQISFDAMLQLRTLGRIVAALQAAGIVPIVLKGYALASLLYADPMLRPAADIDLLVQRIEVERAWAILEPLGLLPPSKEHAEYQLAKSYHLSLLGDSVPGKPVLLELHWALESRGLFSLDLERWRAHSVPFEVEGVPALRFSPEDMLLHLALHMRKHRYVGLRWLCDVAELLRRFQATLNWPYVLETARQSGLKTLLHTTLVLAQETLEAPVPQEALERLRPSASRRYLLNATLTEEALLTPVEAEEAGWTRLAAVEILLLDRPSTMWRELRYRLMPPAEKLIDPSAAGAPLGQRLAVNARRLARRTAALLGRPTS